MKRSEDLIKVLPSSDDLDVETFSTAKVRVLDPKPETTHEHYSPNQLKNDIEQESVDRLNCDNCGAKPGACLCEACAALDHSEWSGGGDYGCGPDLYEECGSDYDPECDHYHGTDTLSSTLRRLGSYPVSEQNADRIKRVNKLFTELVYSLSMELGAEVDPTDKAAAYELIVQAKRSAVAAIVCGKPKA